MCRIQEKNAINGIVLLQGFCFILIFIIQGVDNNKQLCQLIDDCLNENSFILTYFGQRILGIVSSNWVLIRIINCSTQRTISEHFEARMHQEPVYPQISNKKIVENRQLDSHTTVIYSPDNLEILVFCVLPADKISQDERILIEAIIDELTKLFVIINSLYYKNENKTESL